MSNRIYISMVCKHDIQTRTDLGTCTYLELWSVQSVWSIAIGTCTYVGLFRALVCASTMVCSELAQVIYLYERSTCMVH